MHRALGRGVGSGRWFWSLARNGPEIDYRSPTGGFHVAVSNLPAQIVLGVHCDHIGPGLYIGPQRSCAHAASRAGDYDSLVL